MNKIRLREDLNWEQKKNAIEASLIMGFHSTSVEFPIASKEEGIKIPDNLKELEKNYKKESKEWTKDYVSATKEAKSIPELDWRKRKGLESMNLRKSTPSVL